MRRSLLILYILFIVYYVLMMANGIVIEKGAPIVLGFNILFFAYMVFINVLRNPFFLKFSIIYLYLLFILMLILNTSTEYYESLRMFAKYAIAMLAFPAGFNLIHSKEAYKNLERVVVVFMFLFIVNYILSSIFHLGGANVSYGGDTSIETGNLFDEALYLNVCTMILTPLLLMSSRRMKLYKLLMVLLCIIISIVCLKRMVIVCVLLAIITYLVLNFFMNARYGKLTNREGKHFHLSLAGKFIIIVSALVMAVMYSGIFMDQLEARADELRRRLEDETRVEEMSAIYEDFFNNEDGSVALFGKETFNTVGTYANGSFGDRMIHTNFGIMLNGTGFIGLSFYILVNFFFLFIFIKVCHRKLLVAEPAARKMCIAYLSLWLVYNVASFSGTIWLTIYPAFSFLVQGGIYRFFWDNRFYNGQLKATGV